MSDLKTENNPENNSVNKENISFEAVKSSLKKSSKKQFVFLKVVLLITLILMSVLVYVYWQDLTKRRGMARVEAEKFSNIDGDIFDLSEEFKNKDYPINGDLDELQAGEYKEKNSEFLYRLLVKNQMQIEELRKQNNELRTEFLKYKNREKFNKISLTYALTRDKIFKGLEYNSDLQNLELMTLSDDFVKSKINLLKNNLKSYLTVQKINKNFKDLIPEIIALKNSDISDNSFLQKINNKIAKVIVIRRTIYKNSGDIDDKIIALENALLSENYQEALTIGLSFPASYHQILSGFLDNLNSAIEVNKIDQEIINYLKNIN
ncbi:hypothetical protein LBMAG18_07250 [Alphaproteobacteria bacterium]|nr:hypothetical protein LBMAG18_07250 [Alphaproteobacteria bacterium]